MLRLLAVLLLATLLGSGGVAAAIVAGVPAIVQFVFVGSLALLIVTLATGASFARADHRRLTVGTSSPLHVNEGRMDLQPTKASDRTPLVVGLRE